MNPGQFAESGTRDWLIWLGYFGGYAAILGTIALIAWRCG